MRAVLKLGMNKRQETKEYGKLRGYQAGLETAILPGI